MLPMLNIVRAMAGAESLFPPYMQFLQMLFKPLQLDAATARMVILRVAALSKCVYVWRQNAIVARSVGVSEEQIISIEKLESDGSCFDNKQIAALTFTDECVRSLEASEAIRTQMFEHFSPRAVLEAIYIIGTYMFVVRVVRNGRVPLDEHPAASPM